MVKPRSVVIAATAVLAAGSMILGFAATEPYNGPDVAATSTAGATGTTAVGGGMEGEAENPVALGDRLAEIAATEGPQAAIDAFREAVEKDPYAVTVCHGVYEAIGRAATKAAGELPEFYNTECQFGYVHGVLYSLAGKYKTVDGLLAAVKPYCERFVEGDGINGPNSSCNHGIGHLVGTVAETPSAALLACGKLSQDLGRDACVDGVLMEYGEDNLVRYGWMSPGHDNTDIETRFDNSSILSLCSQAPTYATVKCYSRIWMFVAPDTGPEYKSGVAYCDGAPNKEAYERCHVGFGEFISLVDIVNRKISWPPSTPEEVDNTARVMAGRCNTFPEPGHCIYGAIASNIAHLYALNPDESTIPDPCKYIKPAYLEACRYAMKDAKALNWDLENEEEAAVNP